MSSGPLPRRGDRGPAVADLHRLLARAGFTAEGDATVYGDATEEALRRFQGSRGLIVDGVCGPVTWGALVEASHRLGERMLYLRSPMTRGDDVADLQARLGALGFDAGRVDGIFGPDTEAAVRDFQHNSGLVADGVVGRETVTALQRLAGRRTGERTVADVRERERLRHLQGTAPAHAWARRRIVLGHNGSTPALVAALGRLLRHRGAQVLDLHDPDPGRQARVANTWDGDVYLGAALAPDESLLAYFATSGFASHGGQALANRVAERLRRSAVGPVAVSGLRLPILRETRMPAVWCRLAPARAVVSHQAALVGDLVAALDAWYRSPLDDPERDTGPVGA